MDIQTALKLQGIWNWKPNKYNLATVEIEVVSDSIKFLCQRNGNKWENIGSAHLDGNPNTNELLVYWRDTISSEHGNPSAKQWQVSLIEYVSPNEFRNLYSKNTDFPEYGNWTR